MSFISAMTTNDTETENLMPTHSTSNSAVVDFFYNMGASRQKESGEIIRLFERAYGENPLLALKALFYARDVRKGMGERRLFRILFQWLCEHEPQTARKNIQNVIDLGRFDDLKVTLGTDVQTSAANAWVTALVTGNGLAAKWVPRKGEWNGILRKLYGSPNKGHFRRFVSRLTKVVEQQMCAQQWDEINYEHVPSQASLLYRKAFSCHDAERYVNYLESVKKGEKKIHASTLYPHQITQQAQQYDADRDALQVLWDNLPDVFAGHAPQNILPICDVSGSMLGLPMDVSVGLGLYLSERNKGKFHNVVVTFSESPTFFHLKQSSIVSRVGELRRAPWGMNTDLEKVFRIIHQRAVENHVPREDMPSMILILSDMQFDQSIDEPSMNMMQLIEKKYHESGYDMPKVVFWNLRASSGVPVKESKTGVALVSGFSPNIMTSILTNGIHSPLQVVLDTLNDVRYSGVVI